MVAAKKLTGNGVYGDYEPVQFYEFYKVLAQAGGQFLNKAGTAVAFDTAAGLRAVNWLVGKSHRRPRDAHRGPDGRARRRRPV